MSQKKSKPASKPASGRAGSRAAGRGAGAAGPMSVGFLQDLVNLMAQHDLNTVDLRDGGQRIVLKRGAPAPVVMGGMSMGAPVQMASAPAAQVSAAQPAPAGAGGGAAPAGKDDEAGLVPIKSPMVGTFYAASSPDAKPFVGVGSQVDEDTDVCIIEAMKVFNNIKAECRGTIAKVLVGNGQTVEFGTPLFLVKPA